MFIANGMIGIVEDDTGVRTAMQQLLRSAGYATLAFDSAEAFLESGSLATIDCLIADVNLPGMTGVALLATLERRAEAIPAVLMTGRDDAATRELLREQPTVPSLAKPFSDSDLFEAIGNAIRR